MKSRLIMTIAATATLLAGCNNENEIEDTWNGEIRLCSGVTVQQTRATAANPDTQIPEDEFVRICVSKQDADDDASYAGYKIGFTATGTGSFKGGETMFYPVSGKGVSIYAYHPSNAGSSFSVKTNQSVYDTDYYESDLLYSAKKDYPRQSTAHSLTFDHKLSKLTYTLVSGKGTPDIIGATLKWNNVCRTIGFTEATGALGATPSDPANIIPNKTYGAIIVPQTVAANTKLLTVTLTNGKTFSYTPTDAQVFESGKVYNYTITVNLATLSVTSSINPWASITERTGDAEMDEPEPPIVD